MSFQSEERELKATLPKDDTERSWWIVRQLAALRTEIKEIKKATEEYQVTRQLASVRAEIEEMKKLMKEYEEKRYAPK